jgi:hypothetical protein
LLNQLLNKLLLLNLKPLNSRLQLMHQQLPLKLQLRLVPLQVALHFVRVLHVQAITRFLVLALGWDVHLDQETIRLAELALAWDATVALVVPVRLQQQVLVPTQAQCLPAHAVRSALVQALQVLVALVVQVAVLVVRVVQVLVALVVQVAVQVVQAVLVQAHQALALEQVAPRVVLRVQDRLAVAVKPQVLSDVAVSQVRLASQSEHVVKSSTILLPQSLVVCRFNSVAVQQFAYLAVRH